MAEREYESGLLLYEKKSFLPKIDYKFLREMRLKKMAEREYDSGLLLHEKKNNNKFLPKINYKFFKPLAKKKSFQTIDIVRI